MGVVDVSKLKSVRRENRKAKLLLLMVALILGILLGFGLTFIAYLITV